MRIELEAAEAAILEREGIKRGVPPAALPEFVRQWQEDFARSALVCWMAQPAARWTDVSERTSLLVAVLAHDTGHLDALASRFRSIEPHPAGPHVLRSRGLMKGRGGSVEAFLKDKQEQIEAGLE